MVLPSSFPADCFVVVAGPEETENRAGEAVLRQIQIRLTASSLEKISPACQAKFFASANRRSEFLKHGQLFILPRNEMLSIAAMSVGNPDRSPSGING
jgi:hypothetical protein